MSAQTDTQIADIMARIDRLLSEHEAAWTARRRQRRAGVTGEATGRPANGPANFWLKVSRSEPSACWPWGGHKREGYGRFSQRGETLDAHRYAWAWATGRELQGRAPVMHKCNNKACCNPLHLELGTAQQNTADAYRDGLAKSGEQHRRAKLTNADVQAIRRDSRSQVKIAADYGVVQTTISSIKLGRIWKHLGAQS